MYESKKQDVMDVKNQMNQHRAKKQNDMKQDEIAKKMRIDDIRNQLNTSSKVYNDFKAQKQNRLKNEFKEKIDVEKKMIYNLEYEAQELENMEETLI